MGDGRLQNVFDFDSSRPKSYPDGTRAGLMFDRIAVLVGLALVAAFTLSGSLRIISIAVVLVGIGLVVASTRPRKLVIWPDFIVETSRGRDRRFPFYGLVEARAEWIPYQPATTLLLVWNDGNRLEIKVSNMTDEFRNELREQIAITRPPVQVSESIRLFLDRA